MAGTKPGHDEKANPFQVVRGRWPSSRDEENRHYCSGVQIPACAPPLPRNRADASIQVDKNRYHPDHNRQAGCQSMHVKDKVCVVTGAASGIGAAVARAYAQAGARGVVVADLKSSRDQLAGVAGDIDGFAVTADVGQESDIKALIAAAEAKYGPVDIFFSNAGLSRKGQESAVDADWDVSWRVHVMSHVFAARALLPGMLARGSGYLLNTASAAGLLASLHSMPYGVTKNAAVALAEHLAIQHGDRGIRVSVLCPQSVQTGMTAPGPSAARVDGLMVPAEVARMVLEAMEAERFLILSHPQVHEYLQRKASSRDRWLSGMRRLRDKIYGSQNAG